MYIEFLIEDLSGGKLIEKIMDKYKAAYPDLFYRIHSFRGIGYLKKQIKEDDVKTKKLLTDLPIYLKGISRQLVDMGDDTAIVVVLDNDKRDCKEFKKMLVDIQSHNMIQTRIAFCIAIEEMEAWLLGDKDAVHKTFPKARISNLTGYIQDEIVSTGTWELLADIVYPGGAKKMKKDCPTFREIGAIKFDWAEKIGSNIDIHKNTSPSFQYFIKKINSIINEN